MRFKPPKTTASGQSDRGVDDTPGTVQLLIADSGNRTVIREMLSEHFDVETSQTVQDADLYLIEDHLFSEYHEALRERVERAHPTFCPVVLIRRETTNLAHPTGDTASDEGPILIDDVVDAPIDRSLLLRRLHSLFVRRRQSQELSNHVSTLEEREQELRRFERGVESTNNGIVMTDRLGEIEYINPAFEELTGYTESEVIGETPRLLQPEGAADVFTEEFWLTITDREKWNGEVVIEHHDGTRSVVDTAITTTHTDDGEIEGFVIILNDITERIQQEQKLQSREEELDLLRQILTRYLRHNLRNDLNIIHGYTEFIAADADLSDQQRQAAETIIETTQNLVEKSDTARRYGTLLQQDAALVPYDLSTVVDTAVETVKPQYSDVSFSTDIPESCEVRTREGIQDAIEELIENAAKHNDAASPQVDVRLQNSNGAKLVIEDNGPGISEIELATLEQGKETPLSHSQGIGLWLSKWVIESVEGHLSFERLDPGTRVTVEFPSPERRNSPSQHVPALKERDQRLQTVIDRMTDAIVEVNAAEEITFVDERAEAILDVSADDIQGKDIWSVFSDVRGTQFESVYREVMDTRSSQHVEAYYPRTDGWMSVYVYPEFDGGISFYFRDTTERNRHEQVLQQARSRIELALRVTGSTVWEWDLGTDSVTTHPEPHTAFGSEIATGNEFLAAIHPDDRAQVQDALETAIETNTPYSAEYRVQRDGETRWVEDYGERRQDEEDESKRLIGVARDITERKEQMRRYEAIFNQTYQFTGLMEPDGTLIEANETALEFGGISREDVIGKKMWNAHWFEISEQTQTQTKADVQRAADGEFVRRELEVQGADDTAIIDFSIRPITDEDGTVVLLVPEGRDITDLKEREDELQQQRAFLERTEEIARTGGWKVDVTTGEQRWTEGTYEIHGLSSDSGFDPTIDEGIEFYHPDDQAKIRDAVTRCIEQGEPYDLELRLISAEDRLKWVRTNGEPVREDGETVAIHGAIRDISDRKERERELEQTYELLEHTERIADVGSWEIDTDTMDVFWSENLFEILGVDDDEEPPLDEALDVYHEDDRPIVEAAVEDALEAGEPFDVEARFQQSDGDIRWLRVQGTPTVEDGDVVTLRGAVQDVTERKQIEAELREQRDFVEGIVEPSPIGITVVDADGTISFVNDRAEELYGRASEEIDDFTHDDPRWELVDENGKPLETGDTPFERVIAREEPVYDQIVGFLRPSGDRVWVSVNGAPQWDDDGTLQRAIFAFEDVTERREHEEELRNARSQLENAIEAGAIGTWEWHIHDDRIVVGREFARTFGVDPDQARQGVELDRFVSAIHEDDRERVEAQIEKALEACGDYEAEYRVRDTDNELRWVLARGHVECDEDGTPVRFPGVLIDITDQRRTESELAESVTTLHNLYEITSDTGMSFEEKQQRLLEFGCDFLDLPYGFVTDITETTQHIVSSTGDHELLQPGESCPLEESYCRKTMTAESGFLAVHDAGNDGWSGDPAYETFGLGTYIGGKILVNDDLYGTVCFASREPRDREFTEMEETFVELPDSRRESRPLGRA